MSTEPSPPETHPTCPVCGKQFDPDWCGEKEEAHEYPNINHSFIPAGCECGFSRSLHSTRENQ